MEFITLKECLDIMDSGKLFNIRFVTANKELKTGGEWREYKDVVKHTQPASGLLVKTPTTAASNHAAELAFKTKHPNHFENSTRNIRKPNGDIRKVHLRLIREINGRAVL